MANDHYVPRFYLRNFSPTGEIGKIWCYERNRHPSLMGVRSVASEEGYYLLKKDAHGIDSNVVDNIFKDVETHSSPIIRELIGMNKLELSDDDYCMMAFFIAFLFNRTPAFEQDQTRTFQLLLNHFNSLVTSNKDRFRAATKNAGIDVDNEDSEEMEEAQQELMNGVEVNAEQSKRMRLAIVIKTVFDGLAECVYYKKWHLLHSNSSGAFITSDNPVVLLPPMGYRPYDYVGFLDASIFFPLSPERALWLRNDRMAKNTIEVNQKVVDSFNKIIMMKADKQIYSNRKSPDFERIYNEIQKEKETQKSA